MTHLAFRALVQLLPTDFKGRLTPIRSGYRSNWNLGNRWLGKPTTNDARITLDGRDELPPGARAIAVVEPLAEDFWAGVDVGAVLAIQEGNEVVGAGTILETLSRPEHLTRETAEFANQAKQFRAFFESAHTLTLPALLEGSRIRILELYQAALSLPQVEADGPTLPELPPVTQPSFGEFATYWMAYDPYSQDELVAGTLPDDTEEILADLGRGLALWEQGHRASAIWEWRFSFETHWGNHAADALRALHRACAKR